MAMPLIRFKRDDGSDYPDWENIELSKVFTEIKEKNRTDLPVLSVKQGYGTVLRDESGINMVYSKDNLKNYKAMKKDDFIIHLRSFEGGLECSNYDGISSPAYKILRCNDFVLPNVFKHYFRSQRFISNKLSKAVIGIRDGKNIDMNVFWKISIPIPCLEEQQKIADFLSDIDNQIENYQQSLDNLESQKRELLRQVFSQELRFTKDDGSDYPDWEEDKLEHFCDTFSGGTPLTSRKEYYGGNIPFIKSGEIYNLVMSTTITELGFDNSSAKMVENGDLLYAIYGATAGECALSKVKGAINQAILCIRPHGINTSYLLYWLREYKLSILKYKSGLQDNLSAKTIKALTVNYPCSEEQQKIADFFSDFDNRIELERQRLQTMQEIKKGLLQQMFC